MAVEFLTIEDVLHIHQNQIERYGGDHGLVETTLQVATGQIGKVEVAAYFRSLVE